ncbi:MAG: dTDP-4-amino-4,6-dideoxygalactose transaminase [Nocardioides sp.]|jgi:dTDP-4-amino-4,6-dideoxygalactose transaminase
MDPLIRFNVPWVAPDEKGLLIESLDSGKTSSSGPFSKLAAEMITAETRAAATLMTTSCTAALELSAMLLDIGEGDVVIVPSFTFTSSALAFVRAGARILFCDIEPATLGPDPGSVAELLADPTYGPAVKAVVTVHYAGIAGDLEALLKVLQERPDVALVEDNAHGLYGRWRDQPLGSFGRFATQSFHETKNFTCGEGGALVVRDEADVARAWICYDKGTDRQAFLQGQIDKYSWRDTGSSFGMADTLAASLVAQLRAREWVQEKRRGIFEGYLARLGPLVDDLGVTLPHVPADCLPAYHLFHVLLPEAERRREVMGAMKADGVNTTFHYVPLHDSDGGRAFAARPTECPVTTDVSSRLVRLPFHHHLTDTDLDRVVETFVRAVR